jgi:pimeloyl-ACP methyl ester carboxylesterase
MEDVDLWDVWDKITCPTMLIRGGDSDLLLAETAEEMTRRGPKASVIEFPGIGHAPMLMSKDQIGPVHDFLLTDE